MDKEEYRIKVKKLIEQSEEKGLIKTYSEFLETEEAKKYALVQEEVEYYTSNYNKKLKKYKIGDIVFVSRYKYKSGKDGENHSFVIIEDGKAKDSIVKCDDLIMILEEDIQFKIGEVTEEELKEFINAYKVYLKEK